MTVCLTATIHLMKNTVCKIYLTIILWSFFLVCFAQTPAKITGIVIDEGKKPVSFATVSLLHANDSSIVKGALSNDNGAYVFERVVPGNYLIKTTAIGYNAAVSKPFSIAVGAAFNVPPVSMPSASRALKTVTVQASKPLIEHKADRTVMNVENSVLAAGNSAMEILERAPGVSVDKDDNISIKGKKGVTVMINDKLTYLNPAQLATLLRSTDGSNIQSIEIITNPPAKYDAAGNSGIINIKLKKNNQSGTNGSLTLGAGYGAFWKNNENLSLNHKQGKLNIFGTFNHNENKRNQEIGIKRIVTDPANGVTYFNQFSDLQSGNKENSYRFGADYDSSPKNTLGFVINGYFNTGNSPTNTQTYIGPSFNQVDSSLTTVSATHQTYNNFAANINDVFKLDTNGHQLSADLDYSKFNNGSNAQYVTLYFLPDGSPQHPKAFLGNLTPSVIDIRTAKVDYTNPISKSFKFESGLKLSSVKTDNDLTQRLSEADNYASINHFVYNEKIDAAYVNFTKEFKKTSVQLGLRAEYTSSEAVGDSANVIQTINRHYVNLFPSLFINQTLSAKNEIGFSYSRRIDRPQYDNLNPFVFNLDPYTYVKGNPFLKPQYTNNFELNYTYNKQLVVTLGYSHTVDVITEVPGTDPATKVSFITNDNLQVQNNYSINVYTPYTITRWWEGDVNVNGFYLGFKSKNLQGSNLNNGQAAFQARTTQTLSPLSGFKAEVTANYQSALVYSLYFVKPQYSIDAGVSHSFANKKATLKLSVSDIFDQLRNDVSTNYQNTNMDIRQKRESRVTRLTFTYNFGNSKIKAREHESGADAEKGRVKGGN